MSLRCGQLLRTAFLFLLFSVVSAKEQGLGVGIARLDCGTIRVNAGRLFSDAFSYEGQTFPLVESCYLIRHGNNYMLWDTGLSATLLDAELNTKAPISMTLKLTLTQQLTRSGFDPGLIRYIGISHYHPDHTGQLKDFAHAKLFIGSADWDALTGAPPPRLAKVTDFSHWMTENANVSPVARDLDVFGDGTVVILATPGHTPGHKSLLVRLKKQGNILLTGDLAHFRENYTHMRVPVFNTDRADSLASFDRFKNIAHALDAKVVIQHDPKDVEKIPAFPTWAF